MPTHLDRALTAVERLLQLWAVFDHPPGDGGVIHVHSVFEHELFDMARAQRTYRMEDVLTLVARLQRRNHSAYLAHRKRRETEG
jgi:hypothetical protein